MKLSKSQFSVFFGGLVIVAAATYQVVNHTGHKNHITTSRSIASEDVAPDAPPSEESDGGERPVHGNTKDPKTLLDEYEAAQKLEQGARSNKHVHSHFHTLPTDPEKVIYEDHDNKEAGHSFVLLQPLSGADTNEFYGYHLSQYGNQHQHFVIAKLKVSGFKLEMYSPDKDNKPRPKNNFYSVSAFAEGGVKINKFRLIQILEGVSADPALLELEEGNLVKGVNNYNVTLFDGLLKVETPLFKQNPLKSSAKELSRPEFITGGDFKFKNVRAEITRIVHFEHINQVSLGGAEYVVIGYTPGAPSKDYYLIHRIQGEESFQHIVKVEFESPVTLPNSKTFGVFKSADMTPVADKLENIILPNVEDVADAINTPSTNYNFALKLKDGKAAKFKVGKEILMLPMVIAK